MSHRFKSLRGSVPVSQPASTPESNAESQSTGSNLPALNRRSVLGAVAVSIPAVWTSGGMVQAVQSPGSSPASDRIRIASVGTGGKGRNNLKRFFDQPDTEIVAVCDVDESHLQKAVKQLTDAGQDQVATATDYRQLLDRKDIDAVVVSTPDHWHALASIDAMKAGKDVYCEKPLANSVGEGRRMVDTKNEQGRVLQCGSHERSNPKVRFACEQIRAGKLGTIREVRVNMPTEQDHHRKVATYGQPPAPTAPPQGLDYDRWLGPSPKVPFIADRVHFWWRFVLAYGGGEMTDRGAHIIDLAQLALDRDHTAPSKYMAIGKRDESGLYDAFMDYVFVNEYADGLRIVGVDDGPRGVQFIGDLGSLMIHVHGGKLETQPQGLVDMSGLEDGPLGRTESHHRNFLDCVKSREEPFASAEIGHRTATICHLNNIAMRLGRPIEFDPQTETIAGDREAQALLMPEMRTGYQIT